MSKIFDKLYFDEAKDSARKIPSVALDRVLINGVLKVVPEDKTEPVYSPIRRANCADGVDDRIAIGTYAFSSEKTALEAVQAAYDAYGQGSGAWPKATPRERIVVVEAFADALHAARDEIADIIMWCICKNKSAAYKEVDRTVDYIRDTCAELKKLENECVPMKVVGGVVAQIKRSPLGVVQVSSPYNYPLNETYTTLIPALVMGNTVVLKTPRCGGLCHAPTLDMFAKLFPAGVVNIVHGSGRDVFTPIMKSGLVNCLAFIGSSTAANKLHQCHPRPFTVRLALGLDAKNPAIVMKNADIDVAVKECVTGASSFGGQRCTAIKIIFVHESIADEFSTRFAEAMDKLTIGLPWDGADITPLAEEEKPQYLKDVIAEAESKGAKVINAKGKQFDRSYVYPSVLYPCTTEMRIAQEEQFGPCTPILKYNNIEEIKEFMKKTEFGQQASVFTQSGDDLPDIIDFLAHHVTRINVNAQCQRGPDVLPFSGRKNSATGTLSVYDALRAFTIRVAVATTQNDTNIGIFQDVLREGKSNLLRADLLI